MSWETPNNDWGNDGTAAADSWETPNTNANDNGGGGDWGAGPAAGPAASGAWGNGPSDGGDFNNNDSHTGFGDNGPGDNDGERPSRVLEGACRRCGEEGHWAKECPKPMSCRMCDAPDHMAKDCPERICTNCHEKGHVASTCEKPRLVDRSHIPDMTTEAAWELLKEAAEDRDIDDFKAALQAYVKSAPETTYQQIEEAFRTQGLKLWLIAVEKQNLAMTLTNMDLQGNLDKTYTVTYRFQWNPPRPCDRERWPADEAENMERLQDAGEVVPRGVPKCGNCNELGHARRSCPEERNEPDTVRAIKCFNCDSVGHRVRDCPTPRVDKFTCKNCGNAGHKVSDCPEERSAANVECRKCNEMGHFSKDCPQGGGSRGCRNCDQEGHMAKDCPEPKNMAKVQCRNCDEFGHTGKECPKPRDISRVKCSNCQQMGHFKSKCTNSHVDDDAVQNDGGNSNGGGGGFEAPGFESSGFDGGHAGGGNDSWNAQAAEPAAGGSGGWDSGPAPAADW